MESQVLSPRSRLVAALLCFLFGIFGAHRFYVGKGGTAVLMIVTFGGLGVWAMIDLVFILVGSFRDADNRRVFRWLEPPPDEPQMGELTDRIKVLEQRLNDIQDIILAVDEKLTRSHFQS